jgi:predicted amidohydrolase
MANPSGKIIGIVRKRYPSLWEAYFFKGSPGEHTFETDFGRVGVGICFDNHTDLPIRKPIPKHSRYIYPGPIGREIIRLMEWQGKLSYTLNKERKKMALSAEQVA